MIRGSSRKATAARICLTLIPDEDVFCVYSQYIDDLMMLAKMIRAAYADEKR